MLRRHSLRYQQKVISHQACLILQAKILQDKALSPTQTLVLRELVKLWKLQSGVVRGTDTSGQVVFSSADSMEEWGT